MSKEDVLLSIEDLEKKASVLNARNAELADMQVTLSKDIEKIQPMLNAAEGRLSALNAEIAVVEKRIAEKEAQRSEELDKREDLLISTEVSVCEAKADYDARKNDLEAKEIVMREEIARLAEARDLIDKGIEKLTNDRTAFAKELSDYGQKISDLIADQKRLADLRSFIETQQAAIDEKETEVEAKAEEITKKEEALAGIESLYAQREAEFRQKDISLVDSMLQLSRLKDELKKREDDVAAKESYAAGEIKIIEEEKKKITLAWLQVNKKIQDKQVDIDLKDLQK